MTPAPKSFRTTRCWWLLPFASILLGGLFLLPGGQLTYLVGLTVTAILFAGSIAMGDYLTGLIRDRWTGPFAITGLVQVLLASTASQTWVEICAPCLLGAAVTTSLYLFLGLLGWVGFGDVKFAAGLGLFVAVPAGWTGLYLLPLALAISALLSLLRSVARRPERPRSAHGPAMAAALAVLMSLACTNLG